jgi:outer membrane receptor protein involved in Fe transport
MLSGFYGYQHSQFINVTDPALAANPRLINAPEHNAGAKVVVPILPDVLLLGARASLSAPRRIDYQTDDLTDWALIADTTVSGTVSKFGLHYVFGVYNLFDWKYAVPVSTTYASRTMPQNGRTFLADIDLSYP